MVIIECSEQQAEQLGLSTESFLIYDELHTMLVDSFIEIENNQYIKERKPRLEI